ncbi:MAG TPA: BrnT family toxin [Terriglobia bacterium]|nr:BrnT family toxin [Terriglobia bacterium]
MYAHLVVITCDGRKEEANRRKHGIRFAPAALVLDDPYAITSIDRDSDPEEKRFVTLGVDAEGKILVLVYTHRGEEIRIISARRATKREREQYRSEP